MRSNEVADILACADSLLQRSHELVTEATSRRPRRMSPVSIQPYTANRKLAPQRQVRVQGGRLRNVPVGPHVTSTYVSIQATCPDSCAFKNDGCYAKSNAAHLTMRTLDEAARGWSALEVTRAEARAIDGTWVHGIPQSGARGGIDLRLHVGGEVSCAQGARELADAAQRWTARGGGLSWSYTHRWATIERRHWGQISVLASVESPEDIERAASRGYAAAIVVSQFDSPKAFAIGRWRAVPCPAEAGERSTCSSCRLCMHDDRLLERHLVIAFAAHGNGHVKARHRLRVLHEGA